MSETFISVVIATYNRRDYVLEAVRSVVAQTCPAHEIIVVVDGSTDGTADALRSMYPSVRVVERPNCGPSIARNTGVAYATGKWVAFLDDDDLWHRDYIHSVVDYITRHPGCAAINTYSWLFSERIACQTSGYGLRCDFAADSLEECHAQAAQRCTPVNEFCYMHIQGESFDRLLARNCGSMVTTAVRRDVAIAAGGFFAAQACGEDWSFFMRVARLTEWNTIPHPLAFVRLHTQKITSNPENGLFVLASLVGMWLSGRPLREQTSGLQALEKLAGYGAVYRQTVQSYLWDSLHRRQFRLARLILLCGKMLLPRWRDRAYAMLPPQITWRWERYILGMHK